MFDDPKHLDHFEAAIRAADQPFDWAVTHTIHAFQHLRQHEYLLACPSLVVGVESLFWAQATKRGLIDADRREYTKAAGRSGRPRSANDIVDLLPINPRVQKFLKRSAFGSIPNQFRHGTPYGIEPREQCLLWMLALAAWLDGYGPVPTRA